MSALWRQFSFLWKRRQIDRDLEEEMPFHVDMKALPVLETAFCLELRRVARGSAAPDLPPCFSNH
jgi:hypothetical protein